MARFNVQPGDVYRRIGSRQRNPHIFILSVDATHAYPTATVRYDDGWWRARGRGQAIGLKRFTETNFRRVASGVELRRREVQ